MKNCLLLACTAAAATNTTTQPWRLKNAKRSAAATNTTLPPWKLRNARSRNATHWQHLKVAILYRGMHYGSYKSERHGGKLIRVNALHPSVLENHLQKIRRPLERAGATITGVFACTHFSDVVQVWLSSNNVVKSEIINDLRKDRKNKVRPNELLQRAYALAASEEWDVLVSVRADLFLKRDLADLTRSTKPDSVLWLPFREVFLNVHHTACAFHERLPNERCLYAWAKHGSRFSDALRIIPRRMLPDVRAAVDELVRHRVWDQHGLAFQLKKLRGYDISKNISALVEGFWDSNVDTRANPLFSLARGSRFLATLPKSARPPE